MKERSIEHLLNDMDWKTLNETATESAFAVRRTGRTRQPVEDPVRLRL
jgi:hypothetical protein